MIGQLSKERPTDMDIRQREFSEGQDRAMAALAQVFPADHLHITDPPYRFSSWALDDQANAAL
jgi:hypothetical protein